MTRRHLDEAEAQLRAAPADLDFGLFAGAADAASPAKPVPPIEARVLVRASDPEPSHAAAAKMADGGAAARERAILRALLHYGPMTAEQIDTACAWKSGTTGKRTSRLKAIGHIEVVGESSTTDGNPCGVYGLTEKGSHVVLSQLNEQAAA
jgi:hypothetical protein